VQDLVDLVEGDQCADRLVGELMAAKQLTEQLQEPADRLVIAPGGGRAGPQGSGDPHDQVDVIGEERIDLDEVVGGDAVTAVGEQLEVGPVSIKNFAQVQVGVGVLVQEAAMYDVADVGIGEVHAQFGREAVFGPGEEGLAGELVELLLAERQQPDLAVQAGAEGRGEGAQAVGAVVVVLDVLRDLVDDQEQGRLAVRAAKLEHVADRLDGLVGGFAADVGAGPAGVPGHRVGVTLGDHGVHDLRELLPGHLLVLDLRPRATEGLLGDRFKALPLLVALELELEVGDDVVGGAIAEVLLDHAHGEHVDMLAVAGDAADIEDDGHRIDPGHEAGPGGAQLVVLGAEVAGEQGLGERAAVREQGAVEREAEELGEARLARAVGAGDPAGRQVGAAGAVELVGDRVQQRDIMLVDALGDALLAGVALGVTAGDDVFGDLDGELLRGVLVEVDDRRDVAGDVGDEQVTDTARRGHVRRDGSMR